MDVQTILITNRNLKRKRNKCNQLFGENLNTSPDNPNDVKIRMAIGSANAMFKRIPRRQDRFRSIYKVNKTPYHFELVNEGEEADKLQEQLGQYDNGKPWMLFVHGNNQTFAKNIMKMRKIQHKYDVNMIAFSWPARSYEDKLLLKIVSAILTAAVTKNIVLGFKLVGKALERKIKQYKDAQQKATLSVESFNQAFQLLQSEFLNPLKTAHPDTHVSFLVHSLGHKVLKEAVEANNGLSDFEFDKILLHQADEDITDHPEWIKQLQVAKHENIMVSRNRKDAVLFLSDMLNHVVPDNGQVTLKTFKEVVARALDLYYGDGDDENLSTRIGNRTDIDANYENLQHIEFNSEGKTHDVAWNDSTDEDLIEKIRSILRGTL